jgi:hypothetical protein
LLAISAGAKPGEERERLIDGLATRGRLHGYREIDKMRVTVERFVERPAKRRTKMDDCRRERTLETAREQALACTLCAGSSP